MINVSFNTLADFFYIFLNDTIKPQSSSIISKIFRGSFMDMEKVTNLIRQTKNLQVLYVEDDKETQINTILILENFFHHITVASNGAEGLEAFNTKRFDLVLSDINMPVMDGMEFVKAIRSQGDDVAIVLISAYDDKEYLLSAIEKGVSGYLIKPFDMNTLQEVLEKVLKKMEGRRHSANVIALVNNYFYNKEEETLYSMDQKITLTKNEKALFRLLSKSEGAVYHPIDLEIALDVNNMRSLISRLNKKTGATLVVSIYSEGYRLNTL